MQSSTPNALPGQRHAGRTTCLSLLQGTASAAAMLYSNKQHIVPTCSSGEIWVEDGKKATTHARMSYRPVLYDNGLLCCAVRADVGAGCTAVGRDVCHWLR